MKSISLLLSASIFINRLCFPTQGFITISLRSHNPHHQLRVPFSHHGFQLAVMSDESSAASAESVPSSFSTSGEMKSFRTNNRVKDVERLNKFINSTLIACAIAGIFSLLYHIDASIPHHGVNTLQDEVTRIPLEAWDSYENVLNKSPIATKAATSAIVYTIGDIISQRTEGVSVGNIDRGRVTRSLLAGLIGHGPLSHYWYNFLDGIFNNVLHITEWWAFMPKVAIDQTCWGPFWNNTYILLLGLMRLESFKNIWGDMKRSTIPLIVTGLKLWIPAHCITYGFIPVENRLPWVDAVEIVWVTILASQAASASVEREDDSDIGAEKMKS